LTRQEPAAYGLTQMPSWTIQRWALRDQPDELLAEIYRARAPIHGEETPGDPRRPLQDEITELRHLPDPVGGVVLMARDRAGAIAGLSTCTWEQVPGWDHVLGVRVEVLPRWRRQGLGSHLLGQAAELAEQRGLRLITGRTRESVPSGTAFCARFGPEKAMVSAENRLDLHNLDRELVDRWLADGPARAAGYELLSVAGRTPPELEERVAEVFNVMNTAPRENLDVGDVAITAELVREYEEAWIAGGHQLRALYAVHKASGRFAGVTDIMVRPATPDRVHVGSTAVDPDHRGRGLGKWLKAAMTLRILDEFPGVRWVITMNAGSNDAMLAINRQLGYRVHAVTTTWQMATGKLQAQLNRHPAD
jgi:mycothiol synthase